MICIRRKRSAVGDEKGRGDVLLPLQRAWRCHRVDRCARKRGEYDTWGQLLSKFGEMADENPYRYAGYQYDEETGFYYLIARYYHPTHGVFLSVDPDPGDADDILTQNGYTYANNNPVMLVDPDGHWVWMAINAGFAAYDGYKAYKTGRCWKYVAKKAALGAIGGGRLKAAKHSVYILNCRCANSLTQIYI